MFISGYERFINEMMELAAKGELAMIADGWMDG